MSLVVVGSAHQREGAETAAETLLQHRECVDAVLMRYDRQRGSGGGTGISGSVDGSRMVGADDGRV